MKNSKIPQRIKRFLNSLKKRLKPKASRETFKLALKEPHSIAYQLIGEKTDRVLPLFEDMDLNLQKAGLKINFKAYLSLTIFATILISFAALILIPC